MPKSVYIHIPFCKSICSYCDFCKILYNEKCASLYLDNLEKEIKERYKNEEIETIYIGGGTPSALSIENLEKLFKIIKIFNLSPSYEFTFEMNVSDINKEKLELLKENKVNRVSVGIETVNPKYMKFLNRYNYKEDVEEKITLLKRYFSNINLDLMYAFQGETLSDVESDLSFVINLKPQHISIYSLIIEEHTKLYVDKVKPIDETLERDMYYNIIEILEKYGYNHYEISNFSLPHYESAHNLVYWNNERYYGFGLSASGYIDDFRYTNIKSINMYNEGIYKHEEEKISKRIDMENELILGLRKIKGISKKHFKDKFSSSIEDNFDIIDLVKNKMLIDDGENIYIPKDMLYVSNSILVNFIGGSND